MPDLLKVLSAFKEWALADAGAFAALLTLPLALFVLLETIRLRRVETDPEVTVFLEMRPGSAFLIDLIVKNVGHGQAFDISFSVEPDEPFWREWRFSAMPMFASGLKHMAPGQEVRILVGTFMEIRKEPYTVVTCYKGKERRFRKPLAITDVYVLDVRQFDGQFVITDDPNRKALEKIAAATTQLSKDVKKMASGQELGIGRTHAEPPSVEEYPDKAIEGTEAPPLTD